MPEAPRKRPDNYSVLLTLRGHVKARPKAAFDAIDANLRSRGHSRGGYLADPSAFLVIVQGGWWYRGEYRVVPDATGSHVEHTILNVAQRAKALSGRPAKRAIKAAPGEFAKLMKRLRAEVE
jgi:hypothetical protein